MTTYLQVANLPHGTDEAILRGAFGQDRRKVTCVEIALKKRTGKATGSATVHMGSEADALAAMHALDGSDLHGRVLRVTEGQLPPPQAGIRRRRG